MSQLQLTARFKIYDGKLNEFKNLLRYAFSKQKLMNREIFNMTGSTMMMKPNV